MKSVICSLFFIAVLFLSLPAQASERPLTALDIAELLIQNQGQLDDSTVMAILSQGIESNMRVEPEHLGVAFWDSRTGSRVDRQEIRELIGPVRQDGAWQVLDMALSLSGDRLLLDAEQLQLLMDAAFIASMRRPPQHISIEYYDRRQGPTGQGGGVSGRVPETTYSAPSEPAHTPEPTGRPDSLPASEDELLIIFADLGFTAEDLPNLYLFPMITWAPNAEQLEAEFENDVTGLQELGFRLQELTDDPVIQQDGDWLVLYALGQFQATDAIEESDLEDAKAIHQLLLDHLAAE